MFTGFNIDLTIVSEIATQRAFFHIRSWEEDQVLNPVPCDQLILFGQMWRQWHFWTFRRLTKNNTFLAARNLQLRTAATNLSELAYNQNNLFKKFT